MKTRDVYLWITLMFESVEEEGYGGGGGRRRCFRARADGDGGEKLWVLV